MGSAGRDPSDPSSVRALADTISARAGDYAEGGAVPEKWSSKVLMGAKKKGKGKKKQARTGFAEGGPVQNFDDGGGVYGLDDTGNATAYVPPQTDPMVEIARREAEERARMEAEQRAAQEAAQAQAAREAAAARTGARSMQQPGPQEPSEPQGPTPPANLPDQQARDELSARSAPAGQPPVGPRPPLVFPQVPGGGGGGGTSATDVMGNGRRACSRGCLPTSKIRSSRCRT
jgi:hypothetical protein